MKFYLDHTPPVLPLGLSHKDKIMLTGSCFSENIGLRLQKYHFNCLNNPDGILFNPISIARSLTETLRPQPLAENEIVTHHDHFFSLHHHSSVYAGNREDLKLLIEKNRQSAFDFIRSASCLFISFGSAHVYQHLQSNQVVANCHKQPASGFKKILLTPPEIVTVYNPLIEELLAVNPHLKIVFTVSPVKYLKDGIVENNLSKASLLWSVHEITSANKNCFYFPAYELLNDDLRDYRFYKEDLAHPNEMAISYIWDKLVQSVFSATSREVIELLKKLFQAREHRPLHLNDDPALAAFIERQRTEILKLAPGLPV